MRSTPEYSARRWHTGTVVAESGGGLLVVFPDHLGYISARVLTFYRPDVGDVVRLVRLPGTWWCLGRAARRHGAQPGSPAIRRGRTRRHAPA